MNPTLPLPPEPVITRWGTWVEAVNFYAAHLHEFQSVIETFDSNEAVSIRAAIRSIQSPTLTQHLAFITANYSSLPAVIHALESRELTLCDSLALVNKFKSQVFSAKGEIADRIMQKFDLVLERNSGWNSIIAIEKLLSSDIGLLII